jgi:hypothetical protein
VHQPAKIRDNFDATISYILCYLTVTLGGDILYPLARLTVGAVCDRPGAHRVPLQWANTTGGE